MMKRFKLLYSVRLNDVFKTVKSVEIRRCKLDFPDSDDDCLKLFVRAQNDSIKNICYLKPVENESFPQPEGIDFYIVTNMCRCCKISGDNLVIDPKDYKHITLRAMQLSSDHNVIITRAYMLPKYLNK